MKENNWKKDAWLAGFGIGYSDWDSLIHYLEYNTTQTHLLVQPEFQKGFDAGKNARKRAKLKHLILEGSDGYI